MNISQPVTVTELSQASYAHATYDSLQHTSRTYGELVADDRQVLAYTKTFDTQVIQDTGYEAYSIWRPIGDKGLYKRIKNVYSKHWGMTPVEKELRAIDIRMQLAEQQRAALLRVMDMLDESVYHPHATGRAQPRQEHE